VVRNNSRLNAAQYSTRNTEHNQGLPSLVEIQSPIGWKKPLALNSKLGTVNQQRRTQLKFVPPKMAELGEDISPITVSKAFGARL